MEITAALKHDHDELKALIADVNDSADAKYIERKFEKFATLLAKHSKAEEKIVYAALVDSDDEEVEQGAYEGYTEHMLAATLLTKLKQGTDPLSAEWQAEAKVMQEILEHHIEEEEDSIFADVKDAFEADDREEMGAAFLKAKEDVPA